MCSLAGLRYFSDEPRFVFASTVRLGVHTANSRFKTPNLTASTRLSLNRTNGTASFTIYSPPPVSPDRSFLWTSWAASREDRYVQESCTEAAGRHSVP